LWGLLLLFIGSPVLVPLGILSLLGQGLKLLNGYFGKALGARLVPVEGKYSFSFRWLTSCVKLDEVRLGSLRGLHREAVHKRWFDTLTTIIIVSGLLTTSSYQAVYSSYAVYTATPGKCPAAVAAASGESSNVADACPAPGAAEVGFRTANAISFLTSITTIVSSAMVIFAINEFVLDPDDTTKALNVELADWSCVLIHIGYKLATTSFFVSLAASIAAMGFGSPAFFPPEAVGWVIWGIMIATVVCILTGMMVSGVMPSDQHPAADDNATESSTLQEHATVEPDRAAGGLCILMLCLCSMTNLLWQLGRCCKQ
jgi:hypothetical protein